MSSTKVAKVTAAPKSMAPKAVAPKAVAANTGTGKALTIKSGDTLSQLAVTYRVNGGWPALFAANRGTIANPDLIFVGQVVHLP